VRIVYRGRQFWRAIFLKADPEGLMQAHDCLTPGQWSLFTQLQPDEQAHAVRIFQKLMVHGENQPDLLVAALLHDIGKVRYRLNPIERMIIVVAHAILPGQARRWGSLPPGGWEDLPGWRKAFILAEHHAEWGAEMARTAGVSPLAEMLIRRHQHPGQSGLNEPEDSLLKKLRLVDNDS
jgi:putative nucleotidyltransferase with HDIG domain